MRKVDRWMDRWVLPVGLYVHGLDVARVVIEKCRERGWRIPESVAMVAGWNEEAACSRPNPSISSLELPYEQVGYEAARLLDRLMDEKANHRRRRQAVAWSPKPTTILLPPVGIVARRSTDFYAVDDDLVRDAMRYIDTNLAKRLNVGMVADALAVSRRNLETRFRTKLNRTIAAEIQRLRIERTKRELTGTDRTIHQIAVVVGFASPRTLHDAFRAAVGCTPAEFRKRGLKH
ncbi:MAG: helix-turn-helix domain-containing protein [Thermoguttaceae bacterium]|nr:helix-turn-helix domain-containing protein [Thermoguttaceae bacterium]